MDRLSANLFTTFQNAMIPLSNFKSEYTVGKSMKIWFIWISRLFFWFKFKKLARTIVYYSTRGRNFPNDEDKPRPFTRLLITFWIFTSGQCITHRWKAKTTSFPTVIITPIRSITIYSSFRFDQSYIKVWNPKFYTRM